MKPSQLAFLDRYYDFAEKCGDDYEIMARCIKLCGSKQKPNKIVRDFENMGVDSCCADRYDKLMSKVTVTIIDSARWYIQKKRSEKLTLF